MANKLKNLQLTSVDLVRAGANQEADIMLHKSAAAPEAPEYPTEPEKNILKRFIDWLTKNPQEAEIEAHSAIQKADETVAIYKTAIIQSIQSIIQDDTLSTEQKNDMVEKSIGQYHDKMSEIAKYNDRHDKLGRFASKNGGGAPAGAPAGGGAAGKFDTDKQTKEVQNLPGYVGNDKVYDEINSQLEPLFGDGKDTRMYSYDLEYGGIDKVAFFGSDSVENGKATALVQFWAKDINTGERVGMEDQMEVRVTSANRGATAGPEIPDMVGYLSQGMTINAQGKVVPDGSHQGSQPKATQKPKASGKADRSKLTAQMEDLIRRSAEEATKGNFKEADKLYEEGRKIYDQLHKSAYDTIEEILDD